jgi:hypothetical protein
MYADPIRHKEIARLQQIAAEREALERKAPTDEQIQSYLERTSKTVEQEARERRNEEIAGAWVTSHPEYKPTPQGAALLEEYLTARGLRFTPENLSAAFNHLAQKNLVETNEAAVQASIRETAQNAELERRARRVEAQHRTYSTDELYQMPIDELEALTYQDVVRSR